MKSGTANSPLYIPERGNVIWIDFDPQVGREQSKRRPAIVVSPRTYNHKAGLVVVCPISSVVKGYPFEVPLMKAMRTTGVVLADQVKSFDWKARNAKFRENAPIDLINDVLAKIEALLF